MQETTNYSLPYPEGTDIVNLLTILPELATGVDTQMKVNQDAGIQRGTHVKSGTVNAITVPNDLADGAFFTFVASDDFTEGDSFTFNGEVIGARVPSGKALKTGAFTINQNVLCCRYNGILTIFTNQADVAVDLSLNSLSNNAIANSAVSTTFAEVQQQIGNADISGVGANIKAAINALNATDSVQNSAIEEVKSNLSELEKKDFGTPIDISTYSSSSNQYVCPSDGYVTVSQSGNVVNGRTNLYVNGVYMVSSRQYSASYDAMNSIFVKKGMKIYSSRGDGGTVKFYPLS